MPSYSPAYLTARACALCLAVHLLHAAIQPRESFEDKFKREMHQPDLGDTFMYALKGGEHNSGAPIQVPVLVAAVGESFVELDGNVNVRGQVLQLEIEVVGVSRGLPTGDQAEPLLTGRR